MKPTIFRISVQKPTADFLPVCETLDWGEDKFEQCKKKVRWNVLKTCFSVFIFSESVT